jgi:hypothetical protein
VQCARSHRALRCRWCARVRVSSDHLIIAHECELGCGARQREFM